MLNQNTIFDVIIIGSGHAGAALAISLRKKGFTGSILLTGEEAILPYERPPLSKEYMQGKIGDEQLLIRPDEFWTDQRITLAMGCAVNELNASQQYVALADGRTLGFNWCVLATGGKVRRLKCEGADLPSIHSLRNLADAKSIRDELTEVSKIAVIGAGYIGLEFAASARELGKSVTVIETQDRVLSRVTSPVIASILEEQHIRHGVTFHFGQGVSAFHGDGALQSIALEDGTTIPAQMAICGIGIDAETGLAETAGLDCDQGVLVDSCFRTSSPGILAIGDCSRHPNPFAGSRWRLESVQHAQDSAETAADLIIGEISPYAQVPTFWSQQYDLRLQSAGLNIDADDIIIRGAKGSTPFCAIYTRKGQVIAIDAINAPRDFMAARRLIQQGSKPDRSSLTDIDIPLKSLV
ncbi:NAD(P)/FAD-dependent oxidoreductase [Parasphingorhabdus sp.]|uniref:NAD(P)/FAD-dependent oxidoreductase n=1 Tax=Parasphingorhabdus sp. TaxID=2709688 RepID=UPI003A8C9D0F